MSISVDIWGSTFPLSRMAPPARYQLGFDCILWIIHSECNDVSSLGALYIGAGHGVWHHRWQMSFVQQPNPAILKTALKFMSISQELTVQQQGSGIEISAESRTANIQNMLGESAGLDPLALFERPPRTHGTVPILSLVRYPRRQVVFGLSRKRHGSIANDRAKHRT